MRLSPFMLAASLPLLSGSLAAQELSIRFDPARTTVNYTLGAALHTVHGTFKLKSGEIRLDPSTGNVSGVLVVDAASGESGNGSRDNRMHQSILESRQYPEITFRPDRVQGKVALDGDSQVQVHGIFGIHGAEHELLVPAQVRMTPGQAGATLKFQVPYVKWGMKNPSTFVLRVKDTVEIDITASATVTLAPRS